eukprot:TRINITY_DN1259_c1_g1_i6.p3 TRINITY_DN1259_c1_g1~~TRINITY_DN1259_c1_g1_i6.p3  ORF type:complete len:104 (-),score=5.09 TRINITY_DN1259_c1_g1_i6:229-540(-)
MELQECCLQNFMKKDGMVQFLKFCQELMLQLIYLSRKQHKQNVITTYNQPDAQPRMTNATSAWGCFNFQNFAKNQCCNQFTQAENNTNKMQLQLTTNLMPNQG